MCRVWGLGFRVMETTTRLGLKDWGVRLGSGKKREALWLKDLRFMM